jgi:tetratricopeptide (TPR) repeat protein
LQASESATDLASVQAKIVEKRFDAALLDLESLLDGDPDNVEALYMRAVCHRYLRQFDAALETLDKLKSLAPDHGRAHQEEGHTHRDAGRLNDALRAYTRACAFNPALEASWRNQIDILRQQGNDHGAVWAQAQLERLESLPKPLVAATDLIAQGRLLKAEDLCRRFLQSVPHHVEGMRLLADIGIRFGVLDDAELLLENALKIEPDNLPVRIDYIKVLRKRQKFARALEEARSLLDRAPQNPQFQSIYAVECMQAGDYDQALELFEEILQRLPGDAVTLTSKGHALKTRGEYDKAVEAYRAVQDRHPQHGESYYSLANLKVYTFSDEEIDRMLAQDRGGKLGYNDQVYLSFALGKACEDRGDYGTAFEFYAKGNRLKKAQSRYQASTMSDDLAEQRRVCTEDLFARHSAAGCPAPDPIFILGMPRAGSTLLEQILASHSQVDGTLELPNIPALSQRLRRRSRTGSARAYPECLYDLSDEELTEFGEQFIADTSLHRQGAPFFIDKMPNNFRHIGLIKLILPNAKVIDARRDPMACCFSGFKQLFAEGQEFTYDLSDVGQYYRDYVELMDHWDQVLPGFVLRVRHEDVVGDLETQVRRMLDFCSLPFEDACLEFHKTERSVRTPSSEQVRQPIYSSGLAQWRHFEPWLDPLKKALGPILERYPVDNLDEKEG